MGLVIMFLVLLAFAGSLYLGERIAERLDIWFEPDPQPELFDLEACSRCSNPAITTFEHEALCAACVDELLDVVLGKKAPR